ncbi:hypothetical protein [Streptoalloteichus hindustanus]|uniref:Uncharacterized protein n=1 Tax=Streptoalloteichus hindustanus TaxID=2017 RepID=A0A1M5MDA0_STRHI|nr:hypothetical protein [Streptoalloteichus hindustanus]SHG74869.1 hypothetical protein SAMN05444320_11368 [Streptoalloteichus hindustanus]
MPLAENSAQTRKPLTTSETAHTLSLALEIDGLHVDGLDLEFAA